MTQIHTRVNTFTAMHLLQTTACVIALFVCIKQVSGVSCYNCSSTDDPLCADPFWGGSQFLIDCPHSCIKVKQSSTYRQIYHRSCNDAVLASTMLGGEKGQHCVTQFIPFQGEVTQCHCSTQGCNTGPRSISYEIRLIVFCTISAILFDSYFLMK